MAGLPELLKGDVNAVWLKRPRGTASKFFVMLNVPNALRRRAHRRGEEKVVAREKLPDHPAGAVHGDDGLCIGTRRDRPSVFGETAR